MNVQLWAISLFLFLKCLSISSFFLCSCFSHLFMNLPVALAFFPTSSFLISSWSSHKFRLWSNHFLELAMIILVRLKLLGFFFTFIVSFYLFVVFFLHSLDFFYYFFLSFCVNSSPKKFCHNLLVANLYWRLFFSVEDTIRYIAESSHSL